jgi:hypothetical protein
VTSSWFPKVCLQRAFNVACSLYRYDAGCRSVALATPLDLSAFDGVAMSCGREGRENDDERM